MSITRITQTPLDEGKEFQVIGGELLGADSHEIRFVADANSILISVYVKTTSGDVDVSVFTAGSGGDDESPGSRKEIIKFPTVSSPTTELLLRKSALTMNRVRVVVTHSDDCEVYVRARGVPSSAASVEIQGAATFNARQQSVTTTPQLLVSPGLEDRNGILISNNNTNNAILYLGGTEAQADETVGYPIEPGGNIAVNLSAGAELWAVSDQGTIDVRVAETGGGS